MKLILNVMVVCTIAQAIQTLRPGEMWTLQGSDYSGIQWQDKTKKPSQAEVTQAIADCVAQESAAKAQKDQAILDAKDTTKTTQARLDAIIKAIDLK